MHRLRSAAGALALPLAAVKQPSLSHAAPSSPPRAAGAARRARTTRVAAMEVLALRACMVGENWLQ